MADDNRRRTRPGAPVNRGYDAQTQGTLSDGAQQAVAPGSSGYPASVPDPTQSGASYASPSGYPASNQLAASGPTLASIAASHDIAVGPPSAIDVSQITPVDAATANVKTAADAYRALPPDATPVQRAAAMQDYQNSLYDKGAAMTPSVSSADMRARMADFDAGRMDRYNATLESHGENPFSIGSGGAMLVRGGPGNLPGGGGMVVSSIPQEQLARTQAEQQSRDVAHRQLAEQQMRHAAREAARRGQSDEGAILAANILRDQWTNQAKEAGLVSPLNPQAGLDVGAAARRVLERDNSSLAGVAQRPSQDVTPAIVEGAKLAQMAALSRQQAEQDDLARRRRAISYYQ